MFKEQMDGATILFKGEGSSVAYQIGYYNKHVQEINSALYSVKNIFYKKNSSRKSWIDLRGAITASMSMDLYEKISTAPVLEDLSVLPQVTYTDNYGRVYTVGPRDGLDSASAIRHRHTISPNNQSYILDENGQALTVEKVGNKWYYRLTVGFKADISNSLVVFNGCFYPYHVNKNGLSITYKQEDGVPFPVHENSNHEVLDAYGNPLVVDPLKYPDYYSIIPYDWENILKVGEFRSTGREGEWFRMAEPVDDGCLLFYNGVMYYYEISQQNDYMIKIKDIEAGNAAEFKYEDLLMVRFKDGNSNPAELHQQQMVGLFQIDKEDATVYFPSTVSEGLITYNGINSTYVINPDKKSVKFMLPHETYEWNKDLRETVDEGSIIRCVNFYTGNIDGQIYAMPHDQLTNIANQLINKYKDVASTAKRELVNYKKAHKASGEVATYVGYHDTISKYKMDTTNSSSPVPTFILQYYPVAGSLTLYINGIAYKEGVYCYLVEGTKTLVWNYAEKDSGFDLKHNFDVYATYDVSLDANPSFFEDHPELS